MVFHVTNPNPVVAGTPCNIKGRVLAIHGSADPVTPKPKMDAFEEELTQAKVDWQVMMFGARRAFVLRSDRHWAGALRRKALPQILRADARLLRRDGVKRAPAPYSLLLVAATLLGVASAYAQTLTNPDPKSVPPSAPSEKSHAQEHAKTCPAFGAGFVQLPGTDACVKIGASVTTDVTGTGN